MTVAILVRDVQNSDLDSFFSHMQEPEAVHMAAFASEDPSDRGAFDAHWERILSSDSVTIQTIVSGDRVAGSVGSYDADGEREITYWLGSEFWGRGIATDAVSQLLLTDATRPMRARVVKDNAASIRVLEKCGFTISGEDKGFANGRGTVVSEYIMTLKA